MTDFRHRFLEDLKQDAKKTTFMLVLALVFVVLLIWMGVRDKDTTLPAPSTLTDLSSPEPEDASHKRVRKGGLSPSYLCEPLSFEEVTYNPFLSFGDRENPLQTDAAGNLPGGEVPATTQNEDVLIQSIEIEGTITGDGDPIALVNGLFLKEGDQYKGLTINKIGERFVELKGKRGLYRIEMSF